MHIDPLTSSLPAIAHAIDRMNARGIGPQLAMAVARQYGREALDIITGDGWQRIASDVQGIGADRAQALHTTALRLFGATAKGRRQNIRRMQLDAFLGQFGLTPFMERAIRQHFGDRATPDDIEQGIRTDPWQLTDVEGVGFLKADEVARLVGCQPDDPRRLRAGLLFQLQHQTDSDGHCFLPREHLLRTAALMLRQPEAALTPHLDALISERRAIEERTDGNGQPSAANRAPGSAALPSREPSTRIYPPPLYWAERNTAWHLRRLMRSTLPVPSEQERREDDLTDYGY